ncbi:xyloglucanase [Serinibacter arcticus]|uniref:Xyloglucanase n=1 Tax=Serinibacter arcticus TaxID=1655435 RepID=A0A2U1ZT60_9MICO|nr:xyloglucanase [Serinibacter arcticus]PWD50166.1 xyloglucanase [Serinibacter arcticus]
MVHRSSPAAAFVAAAVVAAATLASLPAAAAPADPPPEDPGYAWSNATIHGGGYVPAIVFNPTEPGLAYARTDIGGAYRFDAGQDRWVPMLDHVGWEDWGHSGVLSLATDPVETNRVYVAVGGYTTDSHPFNGAIKRSADHGRTWETTDLPFKIGGNMPGRGIGERLQIDPNDTSTLYYGAEQGAGLWRSTDHGATWAKVEQFPNVGTFVPNPDSEWEFERSNLGVLWTAFVASSGTPRQGSSTLLTAVADTENMLYRSDDAGATWTPVEGAPTGYLPHQFAVDESNSYLYVTLSDGAGPYDGSDGGVWRYSIDTGEWLDISPTFSPLGNSFGYSGLSLDRNDPDTLVVATQIQWWPDNLLYRTTDGGQTWDPIWDYTGPDGSILTRYTQDISASPWITFGADPAPPTAWNEPSPKLGWMMTSFAIDPFDPDHAMYGTGATIYRTNNLTDWSPESPVEWRIGAQGIEETAIQDIVTPPIDGVELVSAMYDLGGFVHTDLDVSPEILREPYFGNATAVDYAELEPSVIVRAGKDDAYVAVGISRDGGATWAASSELPEGTATEPGTVAVAADGTALVWSPEGSTVPQVSSDDGATWTPIETLPSAARVAADRVDPDVFHAAAAGEFFTSRDGGRTFAPSPFDGLPPVGNLRLAAVPGHADHVWIAGGTDGDDAGPEDPYGLWRSTDGGATFENVSSLGAADTIGFGANAPGFADYPALYSSAEVDGVRGIYRSLDEGETWQRINDDENQWAWTGAEITGDLREFGRVLVATNGRGIVVGTTDVVPTAPAPPSPEPSEPEPSVPAPSEPGPSDPGPSDPTSSDPAPSETSTSTAPGSPSASGSLATTGAGVATAALIALGLTTAGVLLLVRRRLARG